MCGIIGIIGQEPVALQLVEALKRLEYRGYEFGRRRDAGARRARRGGAPKASSSNLEQKLAREPLAGTHRHRPHALGDAWPADREQRASARDRSASPSCTTASSRISANCAEELEAKGPEFATETDTEVVAHLVTE